MIIVCVGIEEHMILHPDIENPVDRLQVYKQFKKSDPRFVTGQEMTGYDTYPVARNKLTEPSSGTILNTTHILSSIIS